MLLHMSAHYRSIPAHDVRSFLGQSASLGQSMFDQVAVHLAHYGVTLVSERHTVPRGTPTLLLLCPGVFKKAALVDEIADCLDPDGEVRGDGGRLAKQRSRSRTRVRTGRHRGTKRAAEQGEVAHGAPHGAPPLLTIYSTRLPFKAYISACPALLQQLGLLSFMFEKWPEDDELQDVAAQLMVRQMPPEAEADAAAVTRAAEEARHVVAPACSAGDDDSSQTSPPRRPGGRPGGRGGSDGEASSRDAAAARIQSIARGRSARRAKAAKLSDADFDRATEEERKLARRASLRAADNLIESSVAEPKSAPGRASVLADRRSAEATARLAAGLGSKREGAASTGECGRPSASSQGSTSPGQKRAGSPELSVLPTPGARPAPANLGDEAGPAGLTVYEA